MHALDDVSAVVKHSADVFRIHGAGEVRVAVVPTVSARCTDPLRGQKTNIQVTEINSFETKSRYFVKMNNAKMHLVPQKDLTYQELVSDEIFCPRNSWIFSRLWGCC